MRESEKAMIGVWIDHSRAVIVTLTSGAEHIEVVESHVQWQGRRSNSAVSRVREPRPPDDQHMPDFIRCLNAYYDLVIAKTRAPDRVLIFSPGLAKNERLEENKIGGRIDRVETADKMSEREIAAGAQLFHAAGAPMSAGYEPPYKPISRLWQRELPWPSTLRLFKVIRMLMPTITVTRLPPNTPKVRRLPAMR